MTSHPWHSKLGGRKFLLTILGLAVEVVAIMEKADANAHLTIAGLVGAFVAGNAFVEGKHAGNAPMRRDSSGLPLNG